MSKEIRRYIRIEKRSGYSDYAIEKALLELGYSGKEITQAFLERKRNGIILYSLLGLLAVLLILVGIFFSKDIIRVVNMNILDKEEIPIEDEPYSLNQVKIAETAIKNNDITLCEQAGPMSKYCLAVLNNNINSCLKLKQNMTDYCVMQTSIKNNQTQSCESAGKLKDNCYLFLAIKTKNKTICQNMINGKDYCLNQVK